MIGRAFENGLCEELVAEAVGLSIQAKRNGDLPFGSLLVNSEADVIYRAVNTVVTEASISAHPELKCAAWAARNLDDQRRRQTTLVTSTENCPMCMGAFVSAGIGGLIFALGADALRDWRGTADDRTFSRLSSRDIAASANYEIVVRGPVSPDAALAVHAAD